tara:strand:+ start:871 stop:1092 length:222 start_codon:yes stop_codon:yes gene_type:complete
MIKKSTMVINADSNGVYSTSEIDKRINKISSFIRKYKINEILQLFNLLLVQMSFSGLRLSVKLDIDLYIQKNN